MRRRYRNPPVVEALCEVYFDQSKWDTTVPGLFYDRVRDRFPKKRQISDVQIEVSLSPDHLATKADRSQQRSRFSREDGSRMLQVGPDLVVVNQLRPYPQFEEWRPDVLEAVDLYRELASPRSISKVGVRYINRIDIPASQFAMEDYFALYAQIPDQLGGSHGSFMIRVEIPPRNERHRLLVTFGSAPRPQPGPSLMLDLYDTVAPDAGTNGAIEACLDQAHENIELAFESIITDTTRALFEGD